MLWHSIVFVVWARKTVKCLEVVLVVMEWQRVYLRIILCRGANLNRVAYTTMVQKWWGSGCWLMQLRAILAACLSDMSIDNSRKFGGDIKRLNTEINTTSYMNKDFQQNRYPADRSQILTILSQSELDTIFILPFVNFAPCSPSSTGEMLFEKLVRFKQYMKLRCWLNH